MISQKNPNKSKFDKMSSLFSWLRKKEEVDYEGILQELDADIRETEIDISSIAMSERRVIHAWLYYSVSSYLVLFAAHIFYTRSGLAANEVWTLSLFKFAGLSFGPVL
jgi:hypothetical protein